MRLKNVFFNVMKCNCGSIFVRYLH